MGVFPPLADKRVKVVIAISIFALLLKHIPILSLNTNYSSTPPIQTSKDNRICIKMTWGPDNVIPHPPPPP